LLEFVKRKFNGKYFGTKHLKTENISMYLPRSEAVNALGFRRYTCVERPFIQVA